MRWECGQLWNKKENGLIDSWKSGQWSDTKPKVTKEVWLENKCLESGRNWSRLTGKCSDRRSRVQKLVRYEVKSPKSVWYDFNSKKMVRLNVKKPVNILKGIFSLGAPPPPSLVGAYYLRPPDTRAIFSHNDLLCNGTCSVSGGA